VVAAARPRVPSGVRVASRPVVARARSSGVKSLTTSPRRR
jgi:hypothetical protein